MMMECVAVTTFIQFLEEGCDSTATLNKITTNLLHKVSQELTHYITKLSAGLVLLEDLLNAVQLLVKHNGTCFQQLTETGLLELISVIFQSLLLRLARDGSSESLQIILELLLETVNVLADINPAAKSTVLLKLFTHFLDLLQNELLSFQTRMEVMKSANMLLEQCPTHTKECFLENVDVSDKIISLVDLVKTVGDYEFQVGILEGLIRLFPRKFRQKYASQFFTDLDMLEGFLKIKDKDFEIDCRQVLNVLNSRPNLNHGVVSLPCVSAFVGSKELRKPSDSGYDQFWVDFNIGSQRLTLFCEQDSILSQATTDEEMWETVAIYKTDVHRCSCSEIEGSIVLEICLKSPVCQLYPSQHQDVTDNKILIEFDLLLEADVTAATALAFDFAELTKQNKVSEVKKPVQISITQVQHQDSQSSIQPVTAPVPGTPAGSVCSQESARRRKVSIPSIAMFSPVPPRPQSSTTATQQKDIGVAKQNTHLEPSPSPDKDTVSESTNSAGHSPPTAESTGVADNAERKTGKEVQKKPEFAVPKTPIIKASRPREKVKTPVVTVTPPRKKTGKGRKRGKTQHVSEKECYKVEVGDGGDGDIDSVPESQPVPATITDSRNKVDKPAKISKPIKPGFDDSGINMDETKSSVADVSTIGADCRDTNEPTDPDADLEQTRKHRNLIKKTKISSSRSTSDGRSHLVSPNRNGQLNTIIEQDEPCSELNTSQKLLQLKNKALTSEAIASADAANFGFDVLESETDRIPDSLQEDLPTCEDQDQNNVASSRMDNINSVQVKLSNEKCKHVKKRKKNKEQQQHTITDRQTTETCERTKKSQRKKTDKCNKYEISVSSLEMSDEKDNKTENLSHKENKKNKKTNDQFSTIDVSLKELCDLDDIESTKKSNKTQKSDSETNDQKQVSIKNTLDSCVYDFCEPDKETYLPKDNRNRQNKKQAKTKLINMVEPIKVTLNTKPNDLVKSDEKTKTKQSGLANPVEETLKSKPSALVAPVKKGLNVKKSEMIKPVEKERTSRSLRSRNNKKSDKENDSSVEDNEYSDMDGAQSSLKTNFSEKVTAVTPKHLSAKSDNHEVNLNAEEQINNTKSSMDVSGHIVDETPLKLQPASKGSKRKKAKLAKDTKNTDSCASRLNVDTDAKKCLGFLEHKTRDKKEFKRNESCQKILKNASDKIHDQVIIPDENDNSSDPSSPVMQLSQDTVTDSTNECEAGSVDREPMKPAKLNKHINSTDKVQQKAEENAAAVLTSESDSIIDKEVVHDENIESSDPANSNNLITVIGESSHVMDEMAQVTKKNKHKAKQKARSKTASRNKSRKKPVHSTASDSDSSQCNVMDDKGISNNTKHSKVYINTITKTISAHEVEECQPKNGQRKQCKAKSKCNSKEKNLVFQMSYSKSQTKFKANNRMLSYKSMCVKEEKGYDPYDFEGQCETASMASERLTRPDKSKVLNNMHQIKVEEQQLENRSKQPATLRSMKSGKNKKPIDHASFIDVDEDNDAIPPIQLIHHDTKLVQDKRTNKFYRKSNIENLPPEVSTDIDVYKVERKKHQRKKEKSKAPSPVVHLSSEESEIEILRGDDETEQEHMESVDSSGSDTGLNNFSRIVKDIVKSRDKKAKQTDAIIKLEDELPEPLDISEIDITLGDLDTDLPKTPCITTSISSTPNPGSVKRRFYNPLNISVITPQSVSFESDENIVEKSARKQKDKRIRPKQRSVQYKDLSDSEIEKDDGMGVSRNTSATDLGHHSSLLNSSRDTTMKSERSWILERKKTPKVKDPYKTYKRKNKKAYQFGVSSQTEDTDDGNSQDDDVAIPSLPTQSAYCSLSGSLPVSTPTFSYNGLQVEEDPDDLIMTPITPLKTSGKTRKKKDEDDIEVIQTQEDLMVSFNMDYDGKTDLDTSDIGNICSLSQSSRGTKTPQKLTQADHDQVPDIYGKLLQVGMTTMMGDSGFASGPSSKLRPSRSTLKRKYPDVESASEESSLSDVSENEAERSTFVPKKLFRFDHSAALQYTTSDKSTCSDLTEEPDGDFPFQSGLASFMSTFGADIQKQLQAKKQRCEALTRNTLKATQKHFSSTWAEQQQYQSNIADDFQCKMMVELLALDQDIARLRDAELKSEELFKYQMETLRQNHESQNLRINNMKKLQASFTDRTRKVNKYNLNVHKNLHDQMKKEMMELQKKLVHETQQQELVNVRRGLQNLF